MLNVFRGQRPDITPIQTAAIFVAGIPIVSNVLSAFDVFTMNAVQQDALGDALTWGGLLAAALVGGDAVIRVGRNVKDGNVEAAEMEVDRLFDGNNTLGRCRRGRVAACGRSESEPESTGTRARRRRAEARRRRGRRRASKRRRFRPRRGQARRGAAEP